MRIVETKVYKFNELTPEAQEIVIENYRVRQSNFDLPWIEDIVQSLKALVVNTRGVRLRDYSIGEYKSYIKVSFDNSDAENLSGKRAFAWLENNLINDYRIPFTGNMRKEYRKYGEYYRAGMIKSCPFTGYCADDDYIDSLYEDIKSGCTLKEAFENLATVAQRLIRNEIEAQNSDECIREHIEANDYEFTEDGIIY